MKAAKRTNDFKALELRLNDDSVSPHTVYFKEHSVRDQTQDKPSGRTLFIVNIPPYVDEKGLANAFKLAGPTQSVIFSEKPSATEKNPTLKFLEGVSKPTFKVAYLIFGKVSHLDNALKLTELCPLNSEEHKTKLGMPKWIEEYNNTVMPPKMLKEKIELFMKKHDKQMKIAERKDKELEQEDDDGWVTVTKKGKVSSFARTEKVENKILTKEENKRKRKELQNFYTFQIRESKMKHIVALRQKFEEDKRKIAQIKQNRRFKPF